MIKEKVFENWSDLDYDIDGVWHRIDQCREEMLAWLNENNIDVITIMEDKHTSGIFQEERGITIRVYYREKE